MNILVIGASGFVGKNLCEALKNIRDGKDRTRSIKIDEIYEYGNNTPSEYLEEYCKRADYVFNLTNASIIEGDGSVIDNQLIQNMLSSLKMCKNACPVVILSLNDITAVKENSDFSYSQSKQACEELALDYSNSTGATVMIYRSPSIFGKWCEPNFNSVVATYCYNVANNLPLQADENETQLELLYIDDFVDDMLSMLEDGFADINEHKSGYCVAKAVHNVTLKTLKELLYKFENQPKTLIIPEIPYGSFEKKLYSTYLSYLPANRVSFPLKMNVDARGSFTELIKSKRCGQVSVNISKPGVTKGQHWHNTKWEFFIVVSGHGLIQMRKIGSDEVLNFEVSGEKIEAIHMLPGYTHNIINLSEAEDLITVMWANEEFNPQKPDTFGEPV